MEKRPTPPRDEKRCVATNARGERCRVARIRGRDKCFWHSNDPDTVRRRKAARNEAHAALRRLVLKRDQLPDLEITSAADLWSYQRFIAEAVLTGDLDPRAGETAGSTGARMLEAFQTTAEGLKLGTIDPRTIPPEVIAKLEGRGFVSFLGSAARSEKDFKRLEELVEGHIKSLKRRRGDVAATVSPAPCAGNPGTTTSPQPTPGHDSFDFDALDDELDELAARPLARQTLLVELLLDASDLRPFAIKAVAAGLDEVEVSELMETDFPARYRRALVAKIILPRLPTILADLVVRAEGGEVSAAKLMLDFLRGSGLDTGWVRDQLAEAQRIDEVMKDLRSKGDTIDHEGHGKHEDA